MGRGAFAVAFDKEHAVRMGIFVRDAIANGIDSEIHARVLSETQQGMDRLGEVIAKSIHARSPHRDHHLKLLKFDRTANQETNSDFDSVNAGQRRQE